MANLDKMSGYAIAVGGLATVTLTSIAVIGGFKESGSIDNATADKFIDGLVVFGTFMSVIVLALVGKIIISLFRQE